MGTSPKIVNNSAVTFVPIPTSSSPARLEFSEGGTDWFFFTFAPLAHKAVPHTCWYSRNICGSNEWMELGLCLTSHNKLSCPSPPRNKATEKGQQEVVLRGCSRTQGDPWRRGPSLTPTPRQSTVCLLAPRVRKVVNGLFTFEIGSVVLFFVSLLADLDWSVVMKAVSQLASLVKGREPRTAPAVSWPLPRLPLWVLGVITSSFSPSTNCRQAAGMRYLARCRNPDPRPGFQFRPSRSASALEGRRSPQATRGPAGALCEWFPWFSQRILCWSRPCGRPPAPSLPTTAMWTLPCLRWALGRRTSHVPSTAWKAIPPTGYPFLALHVVFLWEHFPGRLAEPRRGEVCVVLCLPRSWALQRRQPVRSMRMDAVSVACVPRA